VVLVLVIGMPIVVVVTVVLFLVDRTSARRD
jgi:hypothetical protein